jgi:nitroreductase
MELLEAIKKRRSIRKFKQLKVDDSILAELIDAARLAPCGGNMQQLRYIVIREPELIKKIFEITAWAGHVQPKRNPVIGVSAPTAFIAITSSAKNPPHADAGAAIQNMMLRGLEFDLGFCWIGAFKPQKANEILGLPEGITTVYLLATGYQDEFPVQEDIESGEPTKYYLDDKDVLHVPKYTVEAITEWR